MNSAGVALVLLFAASVAWVGNRWQLGWVFCFGLSLEHGSKKLKS
jgi:hypothetical protein